LEVAFDRLELAADGGDLGAAPAQQFVLACSVRGTALSLCGSGGFMGPALCNVPAPRSLERDIDGAKPAVGAVDLEADGPALE
jgi:hypothetical protein